MSSSSLVKMPHWSKWIEENLWLYNIFFTGKMLPVLMIYLFNNNNKKEWTKNEWRINTVIDSQVRKVKEQWCNVSDKNGRSETSEITPLCASVCTLCCVSLFTEQHPFSFLLCSFQPQSSPLLWTTHSTLLFDCSCVSSISPRMHLVAVI